VSPGSRVEVYQVWASNGRLRPPSREWFGGYVLISVEGKIARVMATEGFYEGRW
jgi:hypothetical protein